MTNKVFPLRLIENPLDILIYQAKRIVVIPSTLINYTPISLSKTSKYPLTES